MEFTCEFLPYFALMYQRSRWTYYIAFAVCFFIFWFLFKLGGIPSPATALSSTAIEILLDLISLILVTEWLLPTFFTGKRYFVFAVLAFVLIFFLGTSNILIQLRLMGSSIGQYQQSLLKYKEHFLYWFWSDLVAGSYFMIFFVALGGFAIRLAVDRIYGQKLVAEAKADKLQAELTLARNQVNPHFLFNALNTIYYSIDRSNYSARSMTEKFASLLRYQLYECNDQLVPLGPELKFLQDYIELQKERLGKTIKLTYRLDTERDGARIPAHVLITLVENCFKHISQRSDLTSFIDISCVILEDVLTFKTMNSFDHSKAIQKKGIGLLNVKKVLDLTLVKDYALATYERDHVFETNLTIRLK